VKEILKTMGISPERVQMFYCSAAEGQRFQQEVSRISDNIKALGTNPLKQTANKSKRKKDAKKE
jgi:coenzyme F420-reducing hydrogenase delta subunit